MNWLQKTAKNEILKAIEGRGWVEEQLKRDGFDIWQKGNNFFVSSGDWAVVDIEEVYKAIKYVHPDADIQCEAESGPRDDSWTKIF